MNEIITAVFKNPSLALFYILGGICMYNWRELGKQRTKIDDVEKFLENKKLDKSDFSKHKETTDKFEKYIELKKLDKDDFGCYKADHKSLHEEAERRHSVVVQMLQQLISMKNNNSKGGQ